MPERSPGAIVGLRFMRKSRWLSGIPDGRSSARVGFAGNAGPVLCSPATAFDEDLADIGDQATARLLEGDDV